MVKFNLRLGGIRIIVLLVAALAAASADEVSPRSTLYDIDSLIASQPHILLESAWLKWAFIILSCARPFPRRPRSRVPRSPMLRMLRRPPPPS